LTDTQLANVSREEVSALILAAGSGKRFGQVKAFLEFDGTTLLEVAVKQAMEVAGEVIVGLREEDLDRVPQSVSCLPVSLAAGGKTRHDTVKALLCRAKRPLVLLHDVARPLASSSLFVDVLEAAHICGAATTCLPAGSRDSLVIGEDGFAATPLPRERVFQLHTPQAFRRELLTEIFLSGRSLTPEEISSVPLMLTRAGHRVRLVPSSPDNLKITFPDDWEKVQSILKDKVPK